jgi:hypothetical protein
MVLTGILLSSNIFFFAVKELLNALVVIFLAFAIFLFISTRESYERFQNIFRNHLIIFSLISAIIGLIKYILQLEGIDLSFVLQSYQIGTSLNTDYNFNVLFSILGIISLVFNYSKIRKLNFYLFTILLSLNIIFSGSRRGIIFVVVFFLLIFFTGPTFKPNIIRILKRSAFLAGFFAISFFSFKIYTNTYSKLLKNQSTDLLKTTITQDIITKIAYRYYTLTGKKISSYEFYLDLWAKNWKKDSPDKKNHFQENKDDNLIYNGNFEDGLKFWYPIGDKIIHEIVKTPYGNGVKVTRLDGDNASWPLQYQGRDIIFYAGKTYEIRFKYKVIEGTGDPLFKIGFKVDEPFMGPGKSSNLYVISKDIGNGWKEGICSYTFWKSQTGIALFMNSQKSNSVIEYTDIRVLNLSPDRSLPKFKDQLLSDSDHLNKFLNDYDSVFFSTGIKRAGNNLFLNGNFEQGTRFWLPAAIGTKYTIVNTPFGNGINIVRQNGDSSYWSLRYVGRPIIYYSGHTYRLSYKVKVVKGRFLPFNTGWWINDTISTFALPLNISTLKEGWSEAVCSYKFQKTYYDLPTLLNSMKDNSEIEIADVLLEDLDQDISRPIYVDELKASENVASKIVKDNADVKKSEFYTSRTTRWIYSFQIFKDSLNSGQKIYGGGFDYISFFVNKFRDGDYDYPHNPFLSAFLYSGLIGGLIYIYYLLIVIIYFLKNFRHNKFYFFCFLIVFLFSFVSGNTHFSIPVFAIFCIFPFLNQSIFGEDTMQIRRTTSLP